MEQTKVAIGIAYLARLAYRCLEIVRNLGTAGLFTEEAYTSLLLGSHSAVVHVVTDAIGSTAQGAYHQSFGGRIFDDATAWISHLDAYTHFGAE